MKVHTYEKNVQLWLTFIIMLKIHIENQSIQEKCINSIEFTIVMHLNQGWNIVTMLTIYESDEIIYDPDENYSQQ